MRKGLWLIAPIILTLTGCGSTLKSPAGLEILRGVTPTVPTVKAARVHHQAVLVHGGKTLRFQLWTVTDSSSGRLEASGPLGISLATVLWNDSSWQASLPGQSTLLRGRERTLNLPVLNLRDISPSRIFSPFLGRSWLPDGPYRTISAPDNQTILLPLDPSPTWTLLLDNRTGLPIRRQTLWQGTEVEAISFMKWQQHRNILVPGRLVRTTADGQRLELELKDWDALDQLPAGCLQLKVSPGTDTITVGTGENGRKFFQINQQGTEPESHLAPPTDTPDAESDGEWDDESSADTLAPVQEDSPRAKRKNP